MMQKTLTGKLFGEEQEIEYSHSTIGYTILVLRVAMGWIFLQAGLDKLFTPGGWSAAGYLQFAVPEGNPFSGVWMALAGSPLVDGLNIYGQILIGLALMMGLAVRWSAFWGAVMMVLYWMTSLQGGLLAGFPLADGILINDHLIYAFVLFGLGALGAGRIFGLDELIEKMDFVKQNPALKYLLG